MAATRPFNAGRDSALARSLDVPKEHGFWVMLGAVLLSALLRTGASLASVVVAVLVTAATIGVGGMLHKQVRKSSTAQAASTLALGLSGAPIEAAGGLAPGDVAGATLARLIVFSTSLLVVRAAFARSARDGARRSVALQTGAVAVPLAGVGLFGLLGGTGEALACITAVVLAVFVAAWRPNAKKLKPIGISLAVLAVLSAVALVI